MEKKPVPIDLILILITFIWGFNFTVVKVSLTEMTPFVFNATRYFLAIITMWIILLRNRQGYSIEKQDKWPVFGLSLLGHFVYQAFFIIGINYTKAANAAVMLGTIPIWIAILSHRYFDEKLNRKKAIGILTAFLGLAFMIGARGEGFHLSSKGLWGDIMILASAFSFALFTLFSKQYLKKYNTTMLTTLSMTSGGIWIVFAGIPGFIVMDIQSISWIAWSGAIYSGVLSIAISYFIWNYGLKIVGAVRTSAYQNLAPVVGVAIGILVLKEDLNALQMAGAGITIAGVILTRLG
ncbi:EamA/RhaT family transporter [bacterium]|nr:MAG: EamA/RhaT family transporter [bacterium]